MTDSTQRFSSRVENYIQYRPRYPQSVIEILRAECRLMTTSLVADIGSGTGILAELFLQNGNHVLAVEPNRPMREAGERLLRNYPGFRSVPGRAEATTLADQTVDFVSAGQAFHWFDPEKTRTEFLRILKPAGWVMLVWNERDTRATPFLVAYEQLLQRYATDYEQVSHKRVSEKVLGGLYGTPMFNTKTFRHSQNFDFDGIRGRLLSSSYAPEAGYPNHEPMLAELAGIFGAHQIQGRVAFEYLTTMYYRQLQ